MLVLNTAAVRIALKKLSLPDGRGTTPIQRYQQLQNASLHSDFISQEEFQKEFNRYYRVRRNAEWRKAFYDVFKISMQGRKSISFGEILDALHEKTGRYEASFASKLLATLRPSEPVIDSVVLRNMGLRLPYSSAADRRTGILKTYQQLHESLNDLLDGVAWKDRERLFDKTFPEASGIPSIKKLDLMLWQIRN